jgi:amino acid transporter
MTQLDEVSRTKTASAAPKPVVSVVDAIGLIVGIVVGAGIFRTASLVAGNAASESIVLLAWVVGGVVSFIGALVYAELTTAFPHTGGDYHFLTRAFGHHISFLFAWARMTVIQTGSMVLALFVFGDYASRLLPLGEFSSPIYAGLAVAVLTGLNVLGVRQGTITQNMLTSIEVLGLVLVIAAGLSVSAAPEAAATAGQGGGTTIFGLMMVFVLLTYGGWNEAAYVSGELRDVRRNMLRALFFSMLIITGLYVLANYAYLHSLGLAGTAGSSLVAADVMRRAFGEGGAALISVFVAISALTTANATVFTGARSSYAFGCDFPAFGFLGRWSPKTGTPANALLVQGALALALVFLGATTPQGFQTMVDFTAPVFWFFFLLTGISLFVLRQKEPNAARPFRVPLYPVTPILFCLTSTYLLYSSLVYTGRRGALAGIAFLAVGGLILLFVRPAAKKQI